MIRGEQEQEVDVNAPVVPPRGGERPIWEEEGSKATNR